jgi:Tfp pilus assembly major pilin PilA
MVVKSGYVALLWKINGGKVAVKRKKFVLIKK